MATSAQEEWPPRHGANRRQAIQNPAYRPAGDFFPVLIQWVGGVRRRVESIRKVSIAGFDSEEGKD
jgi:hypothetical protein